MYATIQFLHDVVQFYPGGAKDVTLFLLTEFNFGGSYYPSVVEKKGQSQLCRESKEFQNNIMKITLKLSLLKL